MLLLHLIDFLVDYFSNLNVKKIVGGTLVLIGLAILGRIVGSGNPDRAVLYAIGGILIGGAGLIVVYYDIAKDKTDSRYNELDMLSKVSKRNEHEGKGVTAWHMDQGSGDKNTPGKD